MMSLTTKNVVDLEYDQTLHKSKDKHKIDYSQWYGINIYIMFFFTFAIAGWIWEVGLHFVQTGELVNRGVLLGPWLPIYGTGAIAVLILLRKVFNKPILTFFLTMVLASLIEYGTSWFLEMRNGIRWWDYTGYFMNINGRICLFGAAVFGVGGSLAVYIVAPALAKVYKKISLRIRISICIIVSSLFLLDSVYSGFNPNMGKGVTEGYTSNQETQEN